MANDDDDVDFTAVMRQAGVAPVREDRRERAATRGGAGAKAQASSGAARGSAGKARPVSKSGPVAATTTSEHAPVAASPAAKGAATSASKGSPAAASPVSKAGPVAASPVSKAGPVAASPVSKAPSAATTPVELAKLAAALREAQARLAVVGEERDAAMSRVRRLEQERERLSQEHDAITRERDAIASGRDRLSQERDAALRRVGATQAELTTVRERLAAPRLTLAAALTERGLLTSDEMTRALALLAGGESGPRLLSTLETGEVAGLRSALARRLALVCGAPQCLAPAGAAVLTVEPARCEVCGGSDIQRAAHRFARACAAAGITRVRFVGGSPNYRTQLEALFPGDGPPTVRITAGDRRVPLSQSKAQQRSDDLVIIWGATELDHATSGAYRPQQGRVETIAHRGIGRMLELAAERLGG